MPNRTTPTAGALLFAAVLAFGAAWGCQMIAAVSLIPGAQVEPKGYWFAYGLIAALGAMLLVWAARVCRVMVATALGRKSQPQWQTQDAVREYLLLRDCRTRSRAIEGQGGPCPSPKWKIYLNRNAARTG